MKEEKLFTKIMVELKGGPMVNIADLPQEQYEQFLDLMNHVRLAYTAIVSKRDLTTKTMKEEIETFREIKGYFFYQLKKDHPSCFNGMVEVEKYKIIIEKIIEPKEVYQERLQKLWDECDNHNHWEPLKATAKRLEVELIGNSGSKRKRR